MRILQVKAQAAETTTLESHTKRFCLRPCQAAKHSGYAAQAALRWLALQEARQN